MFMFEKPLGMRDTLPALYKRKSAVRKKIMREISGWGYDFIETPTLEYYETVGVQSAILDQQLFKLLDQQGKTLVLRPDMTAPIARVAASRMAGNSPLRLSYQANVFRAQQREGGRAAEFEQIGVELIGDASISADAEAISLMISALRASGLQNFRVAIGHIGFADALFKEILGNQERADKLRRFLYEKNYVGYREHVKSLALSSIDKQRLLDFLTLRGDAGKMLEALSICESNDCREAIDELQKLWSMLEEFGAAEYVKLDLNIVSHMSYYTGILFEVYTDKVGFPLGNGGRYNRLMEKFDRPAAATGFGLQLGQLLEALDETEREEPKYCVIFSQERIREAIEYAGSLRKDGKMTVLQNLSGVEDVDSFTKQFEEVAYFIGSKRGASDE
ncbi:ATP phosphoribosyltransferase regulatory subunit [Bacillus sp. FJAT-42376]|uniref:ATP phosphoribosyltransferase regulatory subunit n=1 Tax=Bacillus sp. FJAT-42376 TaxID=2014076 RepID=UPI000F50DB8B|nr:ATP phosphoribosyltransferase regulatory subunit [Bacillus sp. FJAT-42376]AZB44444.1 ATP phosphoribosyltransferase regulatory subunit [Bacillus sp. FJAT-42376]